MPASGRAAFPSAAGLVLALAGAYVLVRFLQEVVGIVVLFATAGLFALALQPSVGYLSRRGLPRGVAAIVVLVTAVAALGLAIAFAVPPMADELGDLWDKAPAFAERLQGRLQTASEHYPWLHSALGQADLGSSLTSAGKEILPTLGRASLSVFGGIFGIIAVVVLTVYMVADPRPLLRGMLQALPRQRRRTAMRVFAGVTGQVAQWVRATFWMMLIVGVMCGLGLWALGVRSAFLFGLIAGLGEAVPTIGPIITALPPFLVTLADDPLRAVGVLILFFVVQQVENNLLVPRIMASTLKLHPISVLLFVFVMGSLLGPLGILLATPACAATKVLYRELYLRPRSAAARSEEAAREAVVAG